MVSKHITRDYSAHRKDVIRPYDEYVGITIYSFDPRYTRTYIAQDNTILNHSNATLTSWKSWSCYMSSNHTSHMLFDFDYFVHEDGEYRIDILYEQSNHIAQDNNVANASSLDTNTDLSGLVRISASNYEVSSEEYLFDGENNMMKRLTIFEDLSQGNHTVHVEVPFNCYMLGCIIRKTIKYTGNNYYGSNSGKDMGDLMITNATMTISDMMKPSELQFDIGYDDVFEYNDSPSGFFIDYMDEVNFYVKDDDGVIQQPFGGYVSSILPDSNRTKLTIHCADRLRDGENRYILDEIVLGGGTKPREDYEYTSGMTQDFDTYAMALKYLCDIHEITLQSNITENYLVDGEKYSDGFTITFGKNKSVSNVSVTNGYSTMNDNFVIIRNKANGDKQQVWTLYDAKKYSKQPVDISDYGYMHLTYGIGSPKTELKSKTVEKVDTSDITAGVQKFGKCGQSQDKKYLMAIGKISGSKKTSLSKNTIYKTIFENKCPYCGGELVWDSGRSDTGCVYCGGYNGSKRTWGNISETEITCKKCCSDFDAVTGYEKINNPKKHIKKISSSVKSSKAEQNKLHKGEMKAIPKTGISISPDDIFKAIKNTLKNYKYKRGSSTTYSAMKKSGSGDCHAWSDAILTELKRYGVSCKIVQYKTGLSDSHRSVLYLNANGKYVDFPYKDYGFNKNLYATSGSKNGSVVSQYKGHNIGTVKTGSKTTSKTQTTTITTTKNYDKDKPFQGYLKITYSKEASYDASKNVLYLKFTQNIPSDGDGLNDAFNIYWINNSTKKTTSKQNIVDFIRQTIYQTEDKVYLHSIHMIAPVKQPTSKDNDTSWYKQENSTIDESSCKMNLYQITFNNNKGTESDELQSCGKTLISIMKQIVEDSGYYVHMTYGEHRKDDMIHFRVDNAVNPSYYASEGNDNNILSWNSINYSPISSLFNNSVHVYKQNETTYAYVSSRIPISVLEYGEQTTLETTNSVLDDKEAYWNARHNEKYNGEQTYTFTITVPNYPLLKIGDLVQVTANAKKLNTVKRVKSIKISFDMNHMPRVQTEIGLDELAPDLQLKENIRNLRRNAKAKSTDIGSSAVPVSKVELYRWDR